ncbi:MAG TPA: hemerythrin domain-containing protein [Jatrophihabitantaceae bacterium]|jgi:iron-sulfur cluster repair protein YtfE (RIC family)
MTNTETAAEAWRRRATQGGRVDFTMMYVAHDAFNRDLARLVRAAADGRTSSAAAKATWDMFDRQLHTHHSTEDTSLWPRVRKAATDADEIAILDAMEHEHQLLDPLIERVDASLRHGNDVSLVGELGELASTLAAHMRHEEDAALPLVERRIGKPGWDDFGKDIRRAQGGVRAGAQYLPWVLDNVAEPARNTVLSVLPPPARLLYRKIWEPNYRRSVHLL